MRVVNERLPRTVDLLVKILFLMDLAKGNLFNNNIIFIIIFYNYLYKSIIF